MLFGGIYKETNELIKDEIGKNIDKLTIEELEDKYNLYTQKVIALPEGTTIRTVKKAVSAYLKEYTDLNDDDFKNHVSGVEDVDNDNETFFSIDSGWGCQIVIKVEKLKVNVVLVNSSFLDIPLNDDEKAFKSDLYKFINAYLNRKSSNKCPNCGEEILGKGKFCANCGAPLA